MKTAIKKAVLVLLDGFGLGPAGPGNAIALSGMPFLNRLASEFPSFSLVASGLAVGMPWGKFGNSEVGHSAIGTGRIIIQDLARINEEIRSERFFKNKAFIKTLEHVKKHNSGVHLIGCVSPGGIHSHEDHLIALLEFFALYKWNKVFVHMITDGEDAGPHEALNSLEKMNVALKSSGARIASLSSRTYAMDRVQNWALIQKAWKAFVEGEGIKTEDAEKYIKESYQNNVPDVQIPPAVVVENGLPIGRVSDNDAVIFFNFRNDRMRQIVAPFVLEKFDGFNREKALKNLFVVTMTKYADEFPAAVAYEAPIVANTLGDIISKKGLKQVRIAEKEKEAHVTKFFNGGRIGRFDGEERMIVSSKMLVGDEYVKHPEMAAEKIADALIKCLKDDFTLYVVNFANADMIAHTGNIKATIRALNLLDKLLDKIWQSIRSDPENLLVVTADHGNAEELIDPLTNAPDTQHSNNNVPIIFAAQGLDKYGSGRNLAALAEQNSVGTLLDVAPSILYLLGLEKPKEMTGESLLLR